MTTRNLFGGLVLYAITAGAWLAWLGWDTEKTVNPETGSTSGPYAVWQVVGCGVALALIAAVGGWWLRPWLVASVMTAAFTVAWSAQAASTEDSGLWPVGAILVLVGTATGTTMVSAGAGLLRRRRSDPTYSSAT